MQLLRRLKRFLVQLVRGPQHAQGRVEDSAEMEMEKERRRGMRGD